MTNEEKKQTNRPKSLVIAAILLFLFAVFNLVVGIILVTVPAPYAEMTTPEIVGDITEIVGAFAYFILAVVGGVGVLLVRRWGWRFAMAAPIVGILKALFVDVAGMLTYHAELVDIAIVVGWIIGVALQAVIIVLLLRARRRFAPNPVLHV